MVGTWIAQRLEGVLERGRTNPLILHCRRAETEEIAADEDQTRSLVVRAEGLPEVSPDSLFNEAVGNLLARRLGLVTPEPAIVVLADEFVSATTRDLAKLGLKVRSRMGAGVAHIRGLANVVLGSAPSADELEQMTLIYGFDMIAQNPDRRHDNPNCAHKGGSIIAYDFDMCFSFLLALDNSDPCAISKHGICRNHYFRPTLHARKAALSWKPLRNPLGGAGCLSSPRQGKACGCR